MLLVIATKSNLQFDEQVKSDGIAVSAEAFKGDGQMSLGLPICDIGT